MTNYMQPINQSFKEAIKFNHYHIFTKLFRVPFIILMLPIWGLFYIVYFFYVIVFVNLTFASIPSKFLKEIINEESAIHPAPLFLVYLTVFPIKVFYDFIVMFHVYALSVLYFISQVILFLASWGGIQFNPFLLQQDKEFFRKKPKFQFKFKHELMAIIMILLSLITIFLVSFSVTRIEQSNTSVRFVSNYLIQNNKDVGYNIVDAYYKMNPSDFDDVYLHYTYDGEDLYARINSDGYGYSLILRYEFYANRDGFSFIEYNRIHNLNTSRLARRVSDEIRGN